jgi:tripartite-type tricarboxylate transporter receptor subunit TctC
MKESGFDLVGGTWQAVFVPANLPPAIAARLNAAIEIFLRKPETKKLFSGLGFQITGGTPAKLAEKIMQDRLKWAKIIQDAKIVPNEK